MLQAIHACVKEQGQRAMNFSSIGHLKSYPGLFCTKLVSIDWNQTKFLKMEETEKEILRRANKSVFQLSVCFFDFSSMVQVPKQRSNPVQCCTWFSFPLD